MAHCSDCESPLESTADLEFRDVDSSIGFVNASKRYYVANCANCGATIGSGVAAASDKRAGAAGAGGGY
ncbi:hypothetical protein [Halovivax limisalsi]|uniref:hypothetical protein n=1 Tax=Halovivax limisalsi TaxID=1453760 RepID=UPI001FFC2FBE|nr:hypothetical protein [Halovivax limisalsi]